eukprot:GHVN01017706.1.p1 GENE.GHVN01017706.1~~GHVN01017706.1.p1  ORF type:complete len:179 (-),score=38.90 GHVN01017706.1:137-673(-)
MGCCKSKTHEVTEPPKQGLSLPNGKGGIVQFAPEGSLMIEGYITGQIIGPGGQTIKSIQDETGARVQIADDADGDGVRDEKVKVMFSGDPEAIAAAQAKVALIVGEARRPDYEGPQGKSLRREAKMYLAQRDSLFEQADKCEKQGDRSGAGRLRGEASKLTLLRGENDDRSLLREERR